MINVILCDASPDGIQYSKELLRQCPSIRIAAIANSSKQLFHLLQSGIEAEVIILDINLPFTNGLTLLKDIAKKYPDYKILVQSAIDELEIIKLAISFGAVGFLYKKEMVASFMEEAITNISELGYYLNIIIYRELFFLAKKQNPKLPLTGIFSITRQEEAVLKLLQTDKTNKEIATELALSKRTVECHTINIFKKLGVTTRAGAIEIGSFKESYTVF